MARRPEHTVIFAGLHRTDRVDLGPGPAFPVLGQHHLKPLDSDELPIRIESVLLPSAGLPQAGKSVWILWEGAVTQMLDMSSGVVSGLEPEQLADTLSFEAEPLTGVPAGDSAINGLVQKNLSGVAPELQRFWITQIPVSVRKKLEEAVQRSRARLAGVAHPGGLPLASWKEEKAAGEWRRIEVWDQVIFSVRGSAEGAVETRLIRATSGADWWSAELPEQGAINWMGPLPATRIGPGGRRGAEGSPLLTADGEPVETVRVDFPADAVPVEWLRAWAAELTAKARRLPVVPVPSNVSPNLKFKIVGGLAASFALAICLGHGGWQSARAAALTARAQHEETMRAAMTPKDTSPEEEQKVVAENTKLQGTVHELEQKETELTTKFNAAKKAADTAAAQTARFAKLQAIHRTAVPELLAALADAERNEDPGEIVIKDVRQDGSGSLRLSGICLQNSFADTFATKLALRLKQAGWNVGPAQKHRRPDLTAFDFVVELVPTILANPAAPATPSRSIAPATSKVRSQSETVVARTPEEAKQ